MAKMSGSDFYTYILNTFKRTDKSTEVYECIVDTIKEIKLRYPTEDYKEVAVTSGISSLGDYSFDIPDDFGHIIGEIKILEDDSSYPMDSITKQEYDRLESNPEYSGVRTGKPIMYAIYGKKVYLYPVPDSTSYSYEFNYSTEDESTVTSGTSEVPFTDRYREMLKYGVLSRMYFMIGVDTDGVKYRQLFDEQYEFFRENEMDNLKTTQTVEYRGI